jgi:hypothetical protein
LRSLLGVTSLLLACGGAPPPGGPAGSSGHGSESGGPALAVGEVHANVDFTRPGEPTGDLVGWNLGRGTLYAPEGDPLHPEWRTPARVAAAQALAAARPGHGRAPLMRFSGLQIDGAAGGDGYHFYRFVEPGHAPAAGDDMASFEVFALFHEADAAPIITLNFGSGTASEAAAYVAHLNGTDAADPNVAARVHWGVEQPYRQALFELGDESYGAWNTGYSATTRFSHANPEAPGGGDPKWRGKPSASAADFAARGLEYVAAVRAVEPQASFWVPLSQASMDGWGGILAATQSLAPLLTDKAVAGAVIHHYLVDDAKALGWDEPDDLQFALAGAELFRPRFQRLRAALDAVRPGLPVVVTEYHVAGASSRGKFSRGDQAIVGLGLAGMQIFYAQLGVAAACQHLALEFETIDSPDRDPLLEPWYNPFRAADDGSVTAMASYATTRVIAEHLLERAAPLEFSKQVYKDMVVGSETIAAPLVHAAAFVDPVGGAGSVVALHRELQATRTWTIDVPDGWTATAGTQWAPPSPDHDTRAQPVAAEPLAWVQEGARVQVTLRPHSVVALRFAAP